MTLADRAIRNPAFAWMLMAGLILFGWISFNRMGVSLMPDVDFPVVNVNVTMEGAAPEIMETEIVDPIEEVIMGIEGVREVSATAQNGIANITVEFELSRSIEFALQDMQTKVAQIAKLLPREMDPPVFTKSNPEDFPVMWLAVTWDHPLRDLMEYVHDHLKDQFQTVPNVADIFLGGYVDPNLRVWLDATKMDRLQITVDDVINGIQMQHVLLPAGNIETSKQERNVRVLGEAASVGEFGSIILPIRAGGTPIFKTIRIRDVGEVEDGLADVRRISRAQGIQAVGLGIRKQRGSNAVEVANAVLKRMEEVRPILPKGMDIGVNFDSSRYIKDSVHETNFTLLLSAIITSIVCWLFLGSWTSTLNVLLSIPTSIVGTFIFTYFWGFTLNTFTLLALTLVVGIVVDDAIMMLENIVRYREQGMGRIKAAMIGANEITFAAVAASLAVLAVFLPVAFMSGIIGKFFFQFGVTLSVAVLLSLLDAVTLTPMRASQSLNVARTNLVSRGMDRMMNGVRALYRRGLAWSLDHRAVVLVAAAVFFVASYRYFLPRLRKEFVPAQDQGTLFIRYQTPPGSSITFTDGVSKQIEAFMKGRPDVARYYCAIGGFGGGDVDTGFFFVSLVPKDHRPVVAPSRKPLTQQELMGVFRDAVKKMPGIYKVIVQDPSLSGFSAQRGFPVEFTVRGPEWENLAGLSQEIMKRMQETHLMLDIDTDYLIGAPEVHVSPDRERAGERAVPIATIANAVDAMIGGIRVGQYTKGDKRYDIRLRLLAANRQEVRDISGIWVRNLWGELVRLKDVVKVEEKPTVKAITRRNRERAIGIFANIAPGKSQEDALAAVERIGKEVLPQGYRVVLSGSAQTFRESFQSLVFALLMGIAIAYMILASQFNSFVHPFTVLLALPFSVSGAFVGLWLTDYSLNIYSMIGLILLMGIVKKNSILLVDFTQERRARGMKVREALMDACPVRLRPILMTSSATIAGAIPPALALGPGAETRVPMAVVVIGGMIASTLLTLFVVPCAMSLFSRFESERHRKELHEVLKEMGDLEHTTGLARH